MTKISRRTVGSEIIKGLEEAIAFDRGDRHGAVVRRVRVTARTATARPAPEYSAQQVKRIRSRLGLSQVVFGAALNVSPETVRSWEQGRKQPSGPAGRLLEFAAKHPEFIKSVVESRDDVG